VSRPERRPAPPQRPATPAAPAAPAPAGGPPLAVRFAVALALVGSTIAAFAGVTRNGWILFDDPGYVTENPHVTGGLTADNLRFFLHASHGANWHPLTSYSHLLDVQLFGLDAGAHHAVSLGLHALTALALLLVLYRMTGSWWRSAAVAALFALHPLRVESVAWAAERKDVLSGLFFVLTLAAYRRWAMRPGGARMALVAAALALGLLSKPMLVTTPFVLVLLDAWPLGRLDLADTRRLPRALWARLLEKAPLFALAAALAVVTYLVQRASGATSDALFTPAQRVSNALVSYACYALETAWPAHLAIFYPHPREVEWLAASLSGAALIAITALAWRERGRRPWFAVGWLWYVGTLVPVIGLVPVGRQAWADRYSYLPTIGLVLVLVWFAGEWADRRRAFRVAAALAALVACAALGTATARQVARWRDTRTLFEWTLAQRPSNAVAQMCLGDLELKAGRPGPAIERYRAALEAEPDYDIVRNNLASALAMTGHREEAREEFARATRTRASAQSLHNLGMFAAQEGRYAEAVTEFERALALDSRHLPSHVRLAAALVALGRLPEAEQHLRMAVDLSNGDPEKRRLLAEALKAERRPAEALEQYELVVRARPDDVDALVNAAWLRATIARDDLRDGAAAVGMAERARAASPEPPAIVEATLAAAYAEAGRFPEAVAAGERAVSIARAAGSAGEAAEYARQLAFYRAKRAFRLAP
jgi:tetratricopeptide (TPR) repeat protein